jgi:hypothetical protein
MRRDRSRQSVVMVLQESPNYHEGGSPIASGIHVALRETWSDIPTYPVINPISCNGELAHGPVPTLSASRSAPSCKRITECLGSAAIAAPARPYRKPHEFVGSGLLCSLLQCQSTQPLRVALALFREPRYQFGDLVRCEIAAIN